MPAVLKAVMAAIGRFVDACHRAEFRREQDVALNGRDINDLSDAELSDLVHGRLGRQRVDPFEGI